LVALAKLLAMRKTRFITRAHRHVVMVTTLVLSLSVASAAQQSAGEVTPSPRDGKLLRFATTARGAEFTGLFVSADGSLFFNVQHPDPANAPPFDRGVIGVVTGVDFRGLPRRFGALDLNVAQHDPERVHVALGSYQVLARGGQPLPQGGELGVPRSAAGKPLTDGSKPDFNAYLPQAEGGLLFTAFESRPGAMSRLTLQRQQDGSWQVGAVQNLDFRAIGGTWVNCFGTLSPWGTPLSSEELYFPDTAEWFAPSGRNAAALERLHAYLDGPPNPYRYGYIVEITEPLSPRPRPKKRLALGRFSHENAVVMPDERTVYLSDDGYGAVFFKFIADAPGDLSRGTLYAAKLHQDTDPGGQPIRDSRHAGFEIEWLPLAHGDETAIGKWIADYDRPDEKSTRFLTDAEIGKWATGQAADARAAFLESRKAAAARGASAEFSKMEGVNLNYAGAQSGRLAYLYLAVSSITHDMADASGDIQLDANPCGAVYRLRLDAHFNTHRLEPLLVGGPYQARAAGAHCPADNIAGPDNLLVLDDGRLLIGEDADPENHQINMLWIFDPPSP
jgi:secreted PhoX family phosphatase